MVEVFIDGQMRRITWAEFWFRVLFEAVSNLTGVYICLLLLKALGLIDLPIKFFF